jgi:hypothetical protein
MYRFDKVIYVKSTPFVISFTGTTTQGEDLVVGVVNPEGLAVGQPISGPGIPANTTIKVIGTTTITLSQKATASAKNVPLKVDNSLTPEEKEQGLLPLEPLLPGESILKTGVNELKAALTDLQSQPNAKKD